MNDRSRSFLSRLSLATAALSGAALLVACVASPAKSNSLPVDSDDYLGELPDPGEPVKTVVNEDSGAFGAPARPREGGAGDGSAPTGPTTYCKGALASGDLAIVELMIESQSGTSDAGEWVEIKNMRSCTLVVQGLVVASPRGTTSNSVTVAEAYDLAPGATFIVADSADPALNNGLPGKVFAWDATDVLKNDSDSVTLTLGDATIDAVTYPALSDLTPGRSFAFPSDCAAGDRPNWARWSLAFNAFAPGFQGTPNAPNDDVSCF